MLQNKAMYMEKIWERLDRYKVAVVGKKTASELQALKSSLLKELSELPGYGDKKVAEYFTLQCANIDARHSSSTHTKSN